MQFFMKLTGRLAPAFIVAMVAPLLFVGNAPAAITLVLIWPMAASLLGQVAGLDTVLAWIDPAGLGALADGATGIEVGQALTGIAVWVAIPAALGLVRLIRSEVR